MSGNQCINHNFEDPTAIAPLPEILTEKCGFCDNDFETCEIFDGVKRIELQIKDVTRATKITEIETKTSNISEKISKIENFMMNTSAEFTEVKIKLAQAEALISMKMQENADLRQNLSERDEEVRKQAARIKTLEEKVEICMSSQPSQRT